MKPYQKSLIALSFMSLLPISYANSNLAFAELEQEKIAINRSQEEKIAEFHAYVNNYLDEYEQWRAAYTTNLDKQKVQLIAQWGSGDVSDQTKNVEYTQDNTVKKVINYEDNTATISIILDPSEKVEDINSIAKNNTISVDGQTLNLQYAKITHSDINYSSEQQNKEKVFVIQQTQAQMKVFDIQADRLIESQTGIPDAFIYDRANNKKMHLLAEAKLRISQINKLYKHQRKEIGIPEPVLVKIEEQPTVAALIDTAAATDTAVITDVAPKPVQAKKVVSYTIKLPNNSLKKRAIKYQELARQESTKWNIDKALVMAIMHSESAFRPDAKSHVPAFGLMQVVPVSAGHDVNKQIRKIDAPMTPKELYIPPVNVETGTAYLHILNSRYLSSITNDQSRLYCTIAAYNTGAGNVARAFNKGHSTNIRKASKIINTMTPDEVYNHLLANLPYDETKNYLKKVNGRIELYK